MKRISRIVTVNAVLDEQTAKYLHEIARAEGDNNRSFIIRKVLREAAEQRGLTNKVSHQSDNDHEQFKHE